MTDAALCASELETLALAQYGENWLSKLAREMRVSVPAASRWKKEGISNPIRARQVRALLRDGTSPPEARGPDTLPSPEDFSVWVAENFTSRSHAATVLGLDNDTIAAMCSGVTRAGNSYELKPWVKYMMTGFNKQSHADLIRNGRGRVDLLKAAEMLQSGMSTNAVARHFDVSPKSLRRYQQEGRLPASRLTTAHRPRFDLERAQRMLERGMTNRQIGKELGVSEFTIMRYQRNRLLPRSIYQIKREPLDLNRAQDLLDAGATIKAVADELGVSRQAIYVATQKGRLRRGK